MNRGGFPIDESSRMGLQVRLHDSRDTLQRGELPDIVELAAPSAATRAERLQRDVEADLVAVLETVYDRPRRSCQLHDDALNAAFLNALSHRLLGEPNNSQTRMFEPGKRGLSVDRQPYPFRILASESVEPEGTEEADDTPGHASCGFGQGVVLSDIGVRKRIKPAADTGQLASCGQPAQVFGMKTLSLNVPKAQKALLFREPEDPSC